jgi:hypothetical protein
MDSACFRMMKPTRPTIARRIQLLLLACLVILPWIAPALQQQYADVAREVMEKHHVSINDLHALMAPDLNKYQIAEDNVHYTKEGSQRMARRVAEEVLQQLGNPSTPQPSCLANTVKTSDSKMPLTV